MEQNKAILNIQLALVADTPQSTQGSGRFFNPGREGLVWAFGK
jgi:hypothetical protein